MKKEFSPGKPEPTALNTVRQHTTNDLRRMLKVDDDDATAERGKVKDKDKDSARKSREELLIELAAQAKEDAEHLKHAFKDQLNEGLIEIETVDDKLAIICEGDVGKRHADREMYLLLFTARNLVERDGFATRSR